VAGGCSKEERLLIPPAISNGGVGGRRPVILQEREHLMLTCAASGDPRPTVAWSRRDGRTIMDGPSLRTSNVPSPVLNITQINRCPPYMSHSNPKSNKLPSIKI
jgi:hypothetical protein